MGRPKGSGMKDPFESLDEGFKNTVAVMAPEEINATIAGIAKAEAENQRNLLNDLQVQEAKAAHDDAVAPYKKLTRDNVLAQKIAMQRGNDAALTAAVKAEAENQTNKALDGEVENTKTVLSDAKAQYTEATKAHVLKVKWCMRVLGDKGKV